MLRHIVMLQFSDRETVEKVSKEVQKLLLDLPNQVDALLSIEVGLNINTKPSAFDLVLTADFNNEAGLDAYRVHPAHLQVLEYLEKVVEKATVVDYHI